MPASTNVPRIGLQKQLASEARCSAPPAKMTKWCAREKSRSQLFLSPGGGPHGHVQCLEVLRRGGLVCEGGPEPPRAASFQGRPLGMWPRQTSKTFETSETSEALVPWRCAICWTSSWPPLTWSSPCAPSSCGERPPWTMCAPCSWDRLCHAFSCQERMRCGSCPTIPGTKPSPRAQSSSFSFQSLMELRYVYLYNNSLYTCRYDLQKDCGLELIMID